jgi:ATP diphosphatase
VSDDDGKKTIADLVAVMAALRTPVTGCPWDLEQTFATIAPYTLEEAYEVADAIERGDMADLEEELGDLLLQVVYHARMAEEAGQFTFADVADGVTRKMIRRHPHVFGDLSARTSEDVNGLWSRIKAEEKAAKTAKKAALGIDTSPKVAPPSVLDGVPLPQPALVRAIKLQDKAAKVGFDWPSIGPVFAKMREELNELEEVATALDPRGAKATTRRSAAEAAPPADAPPPTGIAGPAMAAVKEEFGDLLFVMANVARHLGIDAEDALRGANAKFTRRFHHIEARLAETGRTPVQSTLAEMDAFWDEARAADKAAR